MPPDRLEELIRQRVAEEFQRRSGMRQGVLDEVAQLKSILGGGMGPQGGVYQTQNFGGFGGGQPPTPPMEMGGEMPPPSGGVPNVAAGMGAGPGGQIDPEDYDYHVEIQRRDVYGDPTEDPQTGEMVRGPKLGWDKSVHRWADPRHKAPTLGDLTDDGMRRSESEKRKERKKQWGLEAFFGED